MHRNLLKLLILHFIIKYCMVVLNSRINKKSMASQTCIHIPMYITFAVIQKQKLAIRTSVAIILSMQ